MARSLSLRLATAAVLLSLLVPASASAMTGDPASNRSLSQATLVSCSGDATSSSCISSALADINAAHAAEGVPPMVLPTNFATMSVPVQLLNLANLERVDRGLAPILGLSAALDQDAQAGAAQDADPMPAHFYGSTATSNWAGGDDSALEADFEWMYDDGLGSGNLDCTASDQSGCWGHRHDILWHFSTPIAMGAGFATAQYGPSMTELFVGGDTRTAPGEPDAPVVRPSQPGDAGASSPPATVASRPTATIEPPRAGVDKLTQAGSALRVSVRCLGARSAKCKLTVTIAPAAPVRGPHAGARQTLVLAIASGQTKVIRLALTGATRRLLSVRHRLQVRVVIKQQGRPPLVNRTLTLRTSL